MQDPKSVEALIREVLKYKIEDEDERSDDEIIKAVTSTCSEFLKSFIVIGYDLNGNAIPPLFYAKTDMEADALSQYMQHYFVSSVKQES